MSSATAWTSEGAKDRAATLRNRARLDSNRNFLFWYRELYRDEFKDLPTPESLSILEIGSDTSPLKQFHSNIVTSDILPSTSGFPSRSLAKCRGRWRRPILRYRD